MKDRSLFGIIPFVFIVHALAILWLVSVYTWSPPLPPPKALVFKTVKLSPPPQMIAAVQPTVPLTPPKAEPIPELKPAEVKPPKELKPPEVKPSPPLPPAKPKSPPASKTLPKPQPLPKKQAPKPESKPAPTGPSQAEIAAKAKQKDLLSQAKEKLGKIYKEKQDISLATPSKIETLQSDTLTIDTTGALNVKEAAYRDELAYRLKLLLKLPKYGEVKVRLTVDRSGKVTTVKVQSFQNEENKNYLENNLPILKLPSFGNNFPGVEDYTFTVTLSNEI